MATGKKTGGRQKGTPNKVTADLKQWIRDILADGREQFVENLEQLPPEEYIRAFTTLLNYVLPKQQSMSVEAQINAEYKAMQEMIATAPDEVVEQIARRVMELEGMCKEDAKQFSLK